MTGSIPDPGLDIAGIAETWLESLAELIRYGMDNDQSPEAVARAIVAADEASGVRRVTAQELADQLELARADECQRISLCIRRLKLGTDDELDYDAGLTSALEAVGLVPTDEEPHPWRCGGKNCIWEQTMTNRSGSEKRLRRHLVGFRATPDEKRAIEAASARSGLSVAEFCRSAAVAAADSPVGGVS